MLIKLYGHYLSLTWNSLSAASSHQEWSRIKARVSKQEQVFIFYNVQTPRLIIKTGVYSEEAFIRGNTIYKAIQ